MPARLLIRWAAAALGIAAGAYAAHVVWAWWRYGRPPRAGFSGETGGLLDSFMPVCEVRHFHRLRIAAPAPLVLAAAREMDVFGSPIVRLIIRARELILGAGPDTRPRPRGLLAEAQALGWGVLAELDDREVVIGAVTQPWQAKVVFHALPPEEFAAFDMPGYVKIVWNLRVDPFSADEAVFITETRVIATDAAARARFRRYWSLFSPGMILIRWVALGRLRAAVRRRLSASSHSTPR